MNDLYAVDICVCAVIVAAVLVAVVNEFSSEYVK